MKTKHNVCVKLTEKNIDKVYSILEMFGENPSPGLKEIIEKPELIGLQEHVCYEPTTGLFFKYLWRSENKTLIKPKELKQILARENLKKGDVVVIKTSFAKRTGVFERVLSDGNIGIKTSEYGGYYGDFVRYATDEEKALLEPKKEPVTVTKEVWVNIYPTGTTHIAFSKKESAEFLGNGNPIKGTLTYTLDND